MRQNYTLATRDSSEFGFTPMQGAMRYLTKLQAEAMALDYRRAGVDCVGYNLEAE